MMETEAPAVPPRGLASFVRLAQAGVWGPLERPCSVYDFLHGALNVDDAFILSRIQTILLNSKVVDDMDGAWLRAGSRLALSAAMPGVVGAALRRNGLFARLREGIRCQAAEQTEEGGCFWLELHVYNSMIAALALPLLTCGFAVEKERMPDPLRPLVCKAPFPTSSVNHQFVRLPAGQASFLS